MGKGDESAPIRISDRYVIPLQREGTYPSQQVCVSENHQLKFRPPAEIREKGIKNGVFCMRGVSVK